MITIPTVGDYYEYKPLHLQEEPVRTYLLEIMNTIPYSEEECEQCERPQKREWVDFDRNITVQVEYEYNDPSPSWNLKAQKITITQNS